MPQVTSAEFMGCSESTYVQHQMGGMRGPHHDCVFIHTGSDSEDDSIQSFNIAWVLAFFFIQVQWCYLSLCCHTLVWKDQQCTQWKHRNVEGPSCLSTKPLALHCSYPHWYYILCCSSGSHLWCQLISHDLKPCHAYNMFNMFYVNTYVNHHAFSFAGWSTFYILRYVCSTHQ